MDTYQTFSKQLVSQSRKTVKFKFAVFLLTIITNLLIISFFSYIETFKNRIYQLYGEWRFVDPHYTDQEDISGGITSTIANITMKNNNNEFINLGPISTIDEQAEELFHIQFLSGRMPEKEDEIAVEATTLSTLGIDYKVNQKITFLVNQKEQMEFTLVGILKPYRYEWCLKDKSIIPTAIVKTEESSEKALWLSDEEYHKYKDDLTQHGYENTFSFRDKLLYENVNWGYITVFITMLLFVFFIIYFISKNSFKFIKKEMDILDKLGISLKDKKEIQRWTLFYLCKTSILVGCIGTLLFFYVLSLCDTKLVIEIPFL